MVNPFVGQIALIASDFAPRGWAFCNGQILSVSDYPVLYGLIGNTYGGKVNVSFALPDLRGRVPIHSGQGPGLSNYNLSQKGGEETVTLNMLQIPSHTHLATVTDGNASIPVNTTDGNADSTNPATGVLSNIGNDLYTSSTPNGTYPAAAPVTGTAVTNSLTGGSESHSNIQPYIAINYVISLEGMFPRRN